MVLTRGDNDTADDRRARAVVWAAWAGMLALLVWSYVPVSSRIPLAEDWLTVGPLTGHERDLAAWLWEQNNEHRMPVARLLLLGTLWLAGGDYRAGGWLNMALLAGTAAGLILVSRRIRGRTAAVDAFFPLALLHFGYSVHLLFPFNITFVLSFVLIVAAGGTLFAPESVTSRSGAAVAGVVVLLLPLSGFIGLFFVPPLAAYLLHAGLACWRGRSGSPERRGIGVWLVAAAAGAACGSALYFVGYEHPTWNPPFPGVVPSLKTALKVLSFGFGPAPHFWWAPGVAGAVLLLSASLWVAVGRVRRHSGPARTHAAGAALFLAVSVALAFVVGWSRAGYVPEFGIPLRYVLLAAPAFVASYLTWVVAGSPGARAVQQALALAMLVLLPVNTVAGHRLFADWYHDGMRHVAADLDRGLSIEEIAVRHQPFLVHWWTPDELAERMRWLRDARIAPFNRADAGRSAPGRR